MSSEFYVRKMQEYEASVEKILRIIGFLLTKVLMYGLIMKLLEIFESKSH